MFVLGVLVGRGTAPVNFDIQALQNELKQLKASMIKQERRAMESDSAKAGAQAAFEFYEALKKKEQTEQVILPEKKAASKAPSPSPLVSQKRISKSNDTVNAPVFDAIPLKAPAFAPISQTILGLALSKKALIILFLLSMALGE